MKVWKKVILTLADFEDYVSYKIKGDKKQKEKYDQLELDMDIKSKSPEKITFVSNLKRDLLILVILAIIGTMFIGINKNTKHAIHVGTYGVLSIEFQNYGIGGGVSMTVDDKKDIKLIIDALNKIEKEKDIDVIMNNVGTEIEDDSYSKVIINYKSEKKKTKTIEIHSNTINDGKEDIVTKENSFASLWYKLNYKVTNIENN